MIRKPVVSSNIRSIGYEPTVVLKGDLSKEELKTGIMEVEFTNGSVYQFQGVTKELYEGIMTSESKGKFFFANVRSKFTGVRIPVERRMDAGQIMDKPDGQPTA